MTKQFLGAASIAALMAFGLAACGQESATYDDANSGDTTQYSQAGDSYPSDDETLAGQPTDQERMAQETNVPNAGGVDQSSALREGPVVAIADIRVKSDAEEAASTAFEQADANGDGMLDRSEYITVAMSAESDPSIASSTSAVSGEIVDPTAESSITPGATQTATADSATVDTAFAEAAGDDSILSKEELRAAFLARFDEADVDGDAQLSDEEQMTFAALTAGEQAAPQE
ncbi:MAG: hypothetical protein RIE56_10410 [Amphiplicatus sp.]